MSLNPYFAIILAATLGGSSGVFVKLLNLPSTSLSFFRMFIPAAILLVFFSYKKTKLFTGNFKLMLLASLFNAIRLFLYIFAFLHTSISNAIIILFTWPIFATIFSIVLLKEKISKRTALLIILAFIGIIVMYANKEINFSNDDFIGAMAMLGSAIFFALSIVTFKKESNNYSELETTFYQNVVGAIIFLPFIFINQPFPNPLHFSLGILYGFLFGIIAFTLFFYALKRLKLSHYSLFSYWEVPASIIFGFIFFKEIITINMIIGGALIITSGLLLRKTEE